MAIVVVAGGTGNLGGRIINALLAKGAEVRAIVRPGTDSSKLEKLEQAGAKVVTVELTDVSALTKACEGAVCVVSALQGLRDVIIGVQSNLLEAALAAGVARFIPSDYSTDYTLIATGENRNFDLRREFFEHINKTTIGATTIFNGAFAEILTYNIPFLNFKDKTVGYFESPDHKVDFTTMDNTAAFTAAAALDTSAPRILRISGFQINAKEMAEAATEVLRTPFELKNMGSLVGLSAYNKQERTAHPEGEQEVFPTWQRSQYTHSMFSVTQKPLDNNRYPDIKWTNIKDLLANNKR